MASKQEAEPNDFSIPRSRRQSLMRFRLKRTRRTYNRRMYTSMARPQKKGPRKSTISKTPLKQTVSLEQTVSVSRGHEVTRDTRGPTNFKEGVQMGFQEVYQDKEIQATLGISESEWLTIAGLFVLH
mmetsp:Transcript_21147/g.34450  ORF Transcript_21147/g.34450 Transcript_21147/m.34450 type:complete len:127 (+) Transcript_21147:492-872(+)